MKESAWGYLIISLGIVIFFIIMLSQNYSTTSEQDFYLGREVLSSSMQDAVDYQTFRSTGELVMIEEKFVEIFLRRFAESVPANRNYKIDFYDIIEYPPKASVRIRTTTSLIEDMDTGQKSGDITIDNNSFDAQIDTLLSGVLETTNMCVYQCGAKGESNNYCECNCCKKYCIAAGETESVCNSECSSKCNN